MKKILTAISGGVDSGVSAMLLKEGGNQVSGVFMRHRYQRTLDAELSRATLQQLGEKAQLRIVSVTEDGKYVKREWNHKDLPFLLPTDATSAMEVAIAVGIGLTIIDLDDPFSKIVEDFITRYYSAQTPNPCVLCNRYIKFGVLWDFAQSQGFDFLATGHYAQICSVGDWLESLESNHVEHREEPIYDSEFIEVPSWFKTDINSKFVLRSPSPKDQSYFLFRVKRHVLDRIIFPVGQFSKSEVRNIASKRNLQVANRSDSQEICFVPDQERVDFIRRLRDSQSERWLNISKDTSGPFLSLDGREIGRHQGYEKFTIGQRKGLGIGFGERIFVQKIIPELNAVTLGPYDALAVSEIHAIDANWHAPVPQDESFRCCVKIRYRNEVIPATVRAFSDGTITVFTDRPFYGVAPGQALVCYWRDRLLGGGTIVERF